MEKVRGCGGGGGIKGGNCEERDAGGTVGKTDLVRETSRLVSG